MKIGYASDLHVEFKEHKVPPVPEHLDVLILAGDVSSNAKGLAWAYETYKDSADHIVVVYGNHDYWGKHYYQKVLRRAREYAADKSNLHFLENDAVCIDGVWFIGATLWTDYSLGNQPLNMLAARDGMSDHVRIKFNHRGSFRRILPDDLLAINRKSASFIFDKVRELRDFDPEVVTFVVTHHGPATPSLDGYFEGSPLNPCYVNTFDARLHYGEGPDVWIHGHVHDDKRYKLGRTLVLCNPIGYPGQIPGSKIQVLEIQEA